MRDPTPLESIAVVGLSLRLPGDANDLDGLWNLLESGQPAWTPVPPDRYNGEAFYHPNADDPNGTSNHPGGHFISGDVRDFDHAFFQFSKSQAAAIDPQQRLLMELTYEALESGGIPREEIAGTATSVYTAIFPTDYQGHVYKDNLDLPVYYMTGVETAIFSNRLSHVFDLRGPSMTLDTACSGGLVALHQACQSLRDGESDTAIVAASNLILGPDHFIGLSNLHMLSSTGRCYPFDQRGKGYGRGEGVVVLVLKRLDDAVRARNPVRAVIRSSAIGQDGYTPQSITYPNGQAQADLARIAYDRAGLRPEEVVYIEAHGTGTKAGDKEELKGLAEVFSSSADRTVPLYVGSIKGAIGHTESAAGLASLLKATAMLDRELIPPVAGFATPKPDLPLDQMEIPTKLIPWPHAAGITPRISINSFGFGGTNAHVILERGPRTRLDALDLHSAFPRLFTLSAYSSASLRAMIQAHQSWVEQHPETSLVDLSYTLLHRRSALPYRFSTVVEDHSNLVDALSQGFAISATKPSPMEPDIVMVFTGQGSQWPGMGRELLLSSSTSSSVFRDSIRASRDMLYELGATWDLESELLHGAANSRLNEAELAQPATTCTQIALITLLRAQGVRPNAVVGHSSGEIAASYAAGHLSHAAAIKAAFHRGCMAAAIKSKGMGGGAMLSVGLGEHEAAIYLKDLTRGKAVIACINSPRSVTVSGDVGAVDEVQERIVAASDGTFHRKLPVDTAYHSHHMLAVADDYLARLGTLEREQTAAGDQPVAFVSSVTGQFKTSGFNADYFVANFISPVRFSDAVEALGKARHRTGQQAVFIEIGPHPALSGPVRQCLQHPDVPKFPFDYQAPLQRKVDAVTSVLSLAGKLFERGVQMRWEAVSALVPGTDTATVLHNLPAYTWDHSVKHWHESRVARAYRLRKEPYHDLLGVPVLDATDLEPRWRHFLDQGSLPWLADHVVDGLTIFPGAGYLCMAIEGVAQLARQTFPQRQLETLALRDISFKRGLVVPDKQRVELQLSLKPQAGLSLGFDFNIMALAESGEWYEHCTGNVVGVLAEDGATNEAKKVEVPNMPPGSDTTSHDNLYREMNAVGNTYGPAFAGLDYITMATDASQAQALFRILDVKQWMPAKHQRPHIIHPSTLDLVFQGALPLVGRSLGPGSIMPVHIEEVLLSATPSLHEPNTELDISTLLTSSHFRTAVTDIAVLASDSRVISITGMEFRSLGSRDSSGGVNGMADHGTREICYKLNWQTAMEYLRIADLPTNPDLVDLISNSTMSRHGLVTVGLGASIDLAKDLLDAVNTSNKVTSHDFVDATPGRFDDAAVRLKEFPVQFRALRPGIDPATRGFEAQAYDIVLAASTKWLKQAAVLVKPGSTVLLVLSARDSKDTTWRAALQGNPATLQEQFSFRDTQGRLIVVMKSGGKQLPSKVHILTHSTSNAPAWVASVEQGLRARNTTVSLDTFDPSTLETLLHGSADPSSNKAIVIADDISDFPILANASIFNAVTTLLTQAASIVWLSPDGPADFHQIEGFVRTAHAENDNLRLVTIHTASNLLANEGDHNRLVDLTASAVGQVVDRDTLHIEREYRIFETGAVKVPRLHHSTELNRAIADGSDFGPETETRHFLDTQRPLLLSPDGTAVFVNDDKIHATPLADDMIEVETQSVVVPKAGASASLGEYSGVVAHVGANVKTLKLGDRVFALAPVVGASRLRIPASHAGLLPPNLSSSTASALLLNTISASYALRGIARLLSSGGTVLIHGARTAAGRAAIAVTRSIGARVTATADDLAEAYALKEEVGIDTADILVTRQSLYRRSPRDVFPGGIDAIIQAGDESVPAEVLAHIKPFGCVVVIGPLSAVAAARKPPPNVAFHFVDIEGLVQARPDLTANLVTEAAAVLGHIPLAGLEIPVRDVAEIGEVLRLINTGVHAKAVLDIGPDSTVEVIVPESKVNSWADDDATYVVAGGLGDIGQRFLSLMAHRGAKHLATISRRSIDVDTQRVLQAKLEAIRPGIHLYLLQADISSASSMEAAAATLAHQGAPPVRGVIQSAMVMIDRPLEKTTYDDFVGVTRSKVDGTLTLHRTFSSPDLAFFLSLSSVASIVGAQAEASYNAGNALQDSLAHQEEQYPKSTRFLTVNFGWIEDAVLTINDETRQGALRRAGFSPIRSDELTRFFDHILTSVTDPGSDLTQAIIGFDVDSLAGATAHNGTIHSALFSQVRERRRASPEESADVGDGAAGSGQTFEQVVASGEAEAVTDFVSRTVTLQLARLISVDADRIDARQGSILALGLDSLVAVELRNWVMRQYDAPLQSTEILANQTVQALAEKIVARSKKVVGAAT
ncbi:hypothetical protein MBLNU459_g2831t1 [Dothideomycetes sp. NU459]